MSHQTLQTSIQYEQMLLMSHGIYLRLCVISQWDKVKQI